jgi:branched-chain amino acid transport system substrate-binding protein
MIKRFPLVAAMAAAFLTAGAAQAQIKVGVTVSATGPAASLGIPERNTFTIMPKTIAGQSVEYIVLDDASDTTTAVRNVRRLTAEDKVDVVVGSTVTPNALALVDVAAETSTPIISMAASARIIEPMDDKRRWVFKTPQNDSHMASAVSAHMAQSGVKTMAFIGFNDAYGSGWSDEMTKFAAQHKLNIVASERQVLKIMAANPDAVLIAGSGTPAALPQKTLKERGYRGKIYQTHGVANPDFLRVCGKDCEGTFLPAGPILVAEQLPASNPIRQVALDYIALYEKAYGAGSFSTFGGHAWDAGLLLQNAIPEALKSAQPGTPAFRAALRDALEKTSNLTVSHGVVNMTPTDHLGFDQRARVMVQIVDGKWKLVGDAK